MAQIKGSLIIPLVKNIRVDKKGTYDRYFTDDDWNVIKTTIYPIGWYSFDLYRKMLSAIAQVEARNNADTIYNWGYESADLILEKLYTSFTIEGSISDTIETYMGISKRFFDFGSIKATIVDDTRVQVEISGFPSDFKAFYHIVRGWYARILERAGGKNIESKYLSKTWTGDPNTTIEYSWS